MIEFKDVTPTFQKLLKFCSFYKSKNSKKEKKDEN